MRRIGYAVAALLAVLAIAGCAATDERTRTDDICRQLEASAAKEPGVLGADIDFLYSPVNPGDVSAQIEVGEGTDPDIVASAVTKLIWASELDPLRRIDVSVRGAAATTRVRYELPKHQSELERMYGKRPNLEHAQEFGTGILIGVAALGLVVVLLLLGSVVLVVSLMRRRAQARRSGRLPT